MSVYEQPLLSIKNFMFRFLYEDILFLSFCSLFLVLIEYLSPIHLVYILYISPIYLVLKIGDIYEVNTR